MQWKGDFLGLKDPLTDCTNTVDFFMLFWPAEILCRIVRMTNLYATAPDTNGGLRRGHSWYPLTQCELLCFFGVLILMALKKVPNTRLHWSKSHDLFRIPVVANAMSRLCLESIIRCIHLVDNKELVNDKDDSDFSKIAKTAWLIDASNNLCAQYWNLG